MAVNRPEQNVMQNCIQRLARSALTELFICLLNTYSRTSVGVRGTGTQFCTGRTLMIQQLVAHKIGQTEMRALLDSWVRTELNRTEQNRTDEKTAE